MPCFHGISITEHNFMQYDYDLFVTDILIAQTSFRPLIFDKLVSVKSIFTNGMISSDVIGCETCCKMPYIHACTGGVLNE